MEEYFGKSEILSLGYEKLNVHGFKVRDRIIMITTRKDVPVEIVLSIRKAAEKEDA